MFNIFDITPPKNLSSQISHEPLEMYFYAGGLPKGGAIKAAIVVRQSDHTIPVREVIGEGNHFEAMWKGLLWAMKWALDKGHQSVILYGVRHPATFQATGEWAINNKKALPYMEKYEQLKSQFHFFELKLIPKDENPAKKQIKFLKFAK